MSQLPVKFEEFTTSQLVDRINYAAESMAEYKTVIDGAKQELLRRHSAAFSELLAKKDEPYGGVNVIVDGFKLEYTVPKKIDWNQDFLAKKAEQIRSEWGSVPTEYMNVAYAVPESNYKSWPSTLQQEFKEGRTVSPGSPSLKFSPVKEKA